MYSLSLIHILTNGYINTIHRITSFKIGTLVDDGIGDRQTGKTAIAIDTIINQRANFEAGDPGESGYTLSQDRLSNGGLEPTICY